MYHVLQDLQCIYVFILGAFFVMTSSIMGALTRSLVDVDIRKGKGRKIIDDFL